MRGVRKFSSEMYLEMLASSRSPSREPCPWRGLSCRWVAPQHPDSSRDNRRHCWPLRRVGTSADEGAHHCRRTASHCGNAQGDRNRNPPHHQTNSSSNLGQQHRGRISLRQPPPTRAASTQESSCTSVCFPRPHRHRRLSNPCSTRQQCTAYISDGTQLGQQNRGRISLQHPWPSRASSKQESNCTVACIPHHCHLRASQLSARTIRCGSYRTQPSDGFVQQNRGRISQQQPRPLRAASKPESNCTSACIPLPCHLRAATSPVGEGPRDPGCPQALRWSHLA